MMTRRAVLLLALAALALVLPAPIRVWQWDDLKLKPVAIFSHLRLFAAQTSADLDEDGASEDLILTKGRAIIQTGSHRRWQSPATWQVRQVLIADLNRDDFPEAVLLVWRPFKPWPVDKWLPSTGRISSFHDSQGLSCHIILIGWKQGSFREIWAGSALADPVNRFAAVDLQGNNQHYLVTLEGKYDDPPSAPSRSLKVWEWNGFGFTVVNEVDDPAAFRLMGIAQIDHRQALILSH
jgi:hypothetical protein